MAQYGFNCNTDSADYLGEQIQLGYCALTLFPGANEIILFVPQQCLEHQCEVFKVQCRYVSVNIRFRYLQMGPYFHCVSATLSLPPDSLGQGASLGVQNIRGFSSADSNLITDYLFKK